MSIVPRTSNSRIRAFVIRNPLSTKNPSTGSHPASKIGVVSPRSHSTWWAITPITSSARSPSNGIHRRSVASPSVTAGESGTREGRRLGCRGTLAVSVAEVTHNGGDAGRLYHIGFGAADLPDGT